MSNVIFKLDCLTNMHVGNGDANYTIIDNEVERDPITNYPTINASGVKGALREFFSSKYEKTTIDKMFGSDDSKNTSQGKIKILCADMLSMPARASNGKKAYYKVTSDSMVNIFYDKILSLGREKEFSSLFNLKKMDEDDAAVEYISLEEEYIELGSYKMSDEDFKNLKLPVLARNKLDNGRSVNLWYEEIVPHKSQFTFIALSEDDTLLEEFADALNNKVVQFGGNASIGYGLCRITVMGEKL